MLKYVETEVTFAEIPDHISLCINISGCKNKCKGCHSPHLAKDIGEPLDYKAIDSLIENNKGISCVVFMGGDSDPKGINSLCYYIHKHYPSIKTAWYSGNSDIPVSIDLNNLDYIKLGPYIEEKGPLNVKTTNQRLYEIEAVPPEETETNIEERWLFNITDKFWKNND